MTRLCFRFSAAVLACLLAGLGAYPFVGDAVEALWAQSAQPGDPTATAFQVQIPPDMRQPASADMMVIYPLQGPHEQETVERLQRQFAGKAKIAVDNSNSDAPQLIVRAPADVLEKVRRALKELARTDEPTPARSASRTATATAERTSTSYSAALKKLREAATDADKEAARAELRIILADIFAEDMQAREEQARAIENRLAQLRQQYKAREDARDGIIDLQLKVLEQNAAGLGFPPAGVESSASDALRDLYGGTGRNPSTPLNDDSVVLPPPVRPGPMPTQPAGSNQAGKTLQDLLQTNGAEVSDLKKRGHFQESRDGTLYVYVNTNYPNGPSIIRVVESATGRLLEERFVNQVIPPIEWTDEGVASREEDGHLELRVPLSRETVPVTARDAEEALRKGAESPLPPLSPLPGSLADYNDILSRYRKAKSQLDYLKESVNKWIVYRQEKQPEITIDAMKTESPLLREYELAQSRLQDAEQLVEAHLKLLDLDRKKALLARDAAKTKLEGLTVRYEQGLIQRDQVDDQRAALDAADVEVERANTLYQLFESIKEQPQKASVDGKENEPGDAPDSAPAPATTRF